MGMRLHKILYYLIKLKGRIFLPFVLVYILTAAAAAYYMEPDTFVSYFNAVYWVFTTLATVGFGDYAPATFAGKAFTIGLYITGIGLISLCIGKVIESTYLIERLKTGGRMKYKWSKHIILIGWSEKSKLAVYEILKSDRSVDIVLIDNREQSPLLEERLFYVRGDAAEEDTLFRANLPQASGVIIFADEKTHENQLIGDSLMIDGKTLLIATAITSVEEKMNCSIHVTVEVMNERHIRMFKHVKVDEFIPAREMISNAAVRSLFSHGVTHVYS
jgi:voltage-gated potassium channel